MGLTTIRIYLILTFVDLELVLFIAKQKITF